MDALLFPNARSVARNFDRDDEGEEHARWRSVVWDGEVGVRAC